MTVRIVIIPESIAPNPPKIPFTFYLIYAHERLLNYKINDPFQNKKETQKKNAKCKKFHRQQSNNKIRI